MTTLPEDVWGCKEYQELKEALLEKPGQSARLFSAMADQLGRFLNEKEPFRYLQQVELLVGVLRPLRKDKKLGLPARSKLQNLLSRIAEHVMEFLKKYPLDRTKALLSTLDPGALALVLTKAPLELKTLFEGDDAEDTFDLIAGLTDKDLDKVEKLVKKQGLTEGSAFFKVFNQALVEESDTDLENALEENVQEDMMVMENVELFVHKLAGRKNAGISQEEMKRIWRFLRITTILAAKVQGDELGQKMWKMKTVTVLNKIGDSLGGYPDDVAERVIMKLPRGVQEYVRSKRKRLEKSGNRMRSGEPDIGMRKTGPGEKDLLPLRKKPTSIGKTKSGQSGAVV